METSRVKKIFDEIKEKEPKYKKYSDMYSPLANYVIDLEHLAGSNKIDITLIKEARKILSLKRNPKYKELKKVAEEVGGELFITPLGEYSITLPYDLIEVAKKKADENSVSVDFLLQVILRKELEKE